MEVILFHGRGGQGAFSAAKLLAKAIFIHNSTDKFPMFSIQDSPVYGPERRGAPVVAFVKVDMENKKRRIRHKGPVKDGNIVIILDAALLKTEEVIKTIVPERTECVLVNTNKDAKHFSLGTKVFVVDAQKIASSCGLRENVNTALLGAFAKISKLVSLQGILEVIEEMGKDVEKNQQAARLGFESVRE